MFESLFPSHWTTLRKLMWLKLKGASAVWATVTGNPVSFSAKAAPLRQLKVAFSPVQSGSGDPSPDNVRPITGWDSLAVYHSGADTSNPQTISISLGETVYSGWVDVVTGVLTVDRAIVTFDGSQQDSQFAFATGTGKNRITWNGYQFVGKADVPILSDKLKTLTTYSAAPDAWEVSNSVSLTAARCFIGVPTTIASVEDWKAYVTQNNITLCYYLATPQTIQLTPQEVESLAGDNTMWSNANQPITVTYRQN